MIVALLSCPLINCQAEDTVELQPMFNGVDFTGWTRTNTPPETWTYKEGLLHCTGKPIGELRTTKMYQNFIMELEWRHLVPGGNAGIFVWADDIPARGVPFHRGIEVQVLDHAYGNTRGYTTHGDIFPIHGAKMTPINGRGGDRAFPTELLSNPSPEWNHYRIECRDGEITLAVNGKVVTRGIEASPRRGYICLESEGGKVDYRNVRIAELPDTKLPDDQVAIADRGYQSIYSGLDLRGWQPTPAANHWQTSDWVLRHPGEQESSLEHVSQSAISRFVVDVRLTTATSRAVIVIDQNQEIPVDAPELKPHLQAMGSWNRVEGVRQADGWQLVVNNQTVKLPLTPADSSTHSFAIRAAGAVEFANLFLATKPD